MSYRIEKIIERKGGTFVTRTVMDSTCDWLENEDLERAARQDLADMEECGGFIVVQTTRYDSNEIAINV